MQAVTCVALLSLSLTVISGRADTTFKLAARIESTRPVFAVGGAVAVPVIVEAESRPRLKSFEGAREEASKTSPEPELRSLNPRRWPVQILSAIYGTGGKNADVTARVKEHVEVHKRAFASNPQDLGADPNPTWNKGLHIVYMKDGVRREQQRNENETVLAESFYGPQDAGELRAWLPETRWTGAQPEMQFHPDGTFTTPGVTETQTWEATGARNVRIKQPNGKAQEFVFNHTWSSFSEAENAQNRFHQAK